MFGLGTLSRVVGEVRRDVAAAHARDPAARGAPQRRDPHVAGPACRRCSRTASRTGCTTLGIPLVPRTMSMVSRTLTGIEIHPGGADRPGLLHRPRRGRRHRRDRRDRRRRDALPGRHARRHRLCDRQAPPDARGQRHGRRGREAARRDHRRPRREDRRQLGRHPRRRRRTRPSSATPATRCASTASAPEGPDTDWIHLPDPIADAIKGLSARIGELEHEVAELSGARAPARGRRARAAPGARAEPRRRLSGAQ